MRRLTSPAELAEFAAGYEQTSGYRVPLEYLEMATVLGFRHRGRLAGGAVVGRAPFRILARIPEPRRDEVARRIDPAETAELTCLWLRRSARSALVSTRYWLALFGQRSHFDARMVLGGCEKRSLFDLYRRVPLEVLYEGPVTVDGVTSGGWVFRYAMADFRWPALLRMTAYRTAQAARRTLGIRAPKHIADGQ